MRKPLIGEYNLGAVGGAEVDIPVWVASRPAHVNIDELLVKPVDQATIHKVYRRTT